VIQTLFLSAFDRFFLAQTEMLLYLIVMWFILVSLFATLIRAILFNHYFMHVYSFYFFCYAYLIMSCWFMHLYLCVCIHVSSFLLHFIIICFMIIHVNIILQASTPHLFSMLGPVLLEVETCFHNKLSEKGLIWRMPFHTRIIPIPDVWLVILGLSSLLIN
jgi:hypothetical protein